MIAVDHLTSAVAEALSSGYCPTNKAAFLGSLAALVGIFCIAGIAAIAAARRKDNDRARHALRIAGTVLVVFAIGAAALNLFGLSGCGPHATAGVTRDWPW